jgi:hypothetical protein
MTNLFTGARRASLLLPGLGAAILLRRMRKSRTYRTAELVSS